MKLSTGRVDAQKASVVAPALKVLDQTTRPLHSIAAGTNAALTGKNVLKAAGRGLANKDKTTFSDVLKTVHAPKVVQAAGGFALDVGLDPTTYVTGGAAPALRKTVEKAARDASAKALEQGASREAARAASKRAAAQVLAKGHRPGVEIKVAGKKVATVRAGERASKAHERVHDSGATQLLRHVNPNIRPAGVSRDDWERARAATRRERAISATGESHSRNRAIALSKALKGDETAHQRITDAVEAKDLEKLAPREQKVAHALIRDYEEMFGREKAAKLIHTKLQDLGYLPATLTLRSRRARSAQRRSSAGHSSRLRRPVLSAAHARSSGAALMTCTSGISPSAATCADATRRSSSAGPAPTPNFVGLAGATGGRHSVSMRACTASSATRSRNALRATSSVVR
jgi:hypothetical protein